MNRAIFAYVPVLHEGYRRFFEKWRNDGVRRLAIMGSSYIAEFDHLQRKDPRALDPEQVCQAIKSWGYFDQVHVMEQQSVAAGYFREQKWELIVPREDEMVELMPRHFPDNSVMFDDVFLRWDKSRTLEQKHLDLSGEYTLTVDAFDVEIMQRAFAAAGMASDWYRQVGAIIVKSGEILAIGHNTHQPSPHMPYALGSPRGFFKKGLHVDLTTDEHAEPQVIGPLAADGVPLKGAWLYVTTFPCPPCAKLVGNCSFERVYFAEGYAMLDGEDTLRRRNVQLYRVQMPLAA